MRNLYEIDGYRIKDAQVVRTYGSTGDGGNGVFEVRSQHDGAPLLVVASNGGGWDHVSVSCGRRLPNYGDMVDVFKLFFKPDETAMQLHVPAAEHINCHPNCLHLWRPQLQAIPKPPRNMIA